MLICNISLCSYPCVGILVICILPLGVSAQRDNNGQRVWADSVMRVLYDNQDLDAAVKSKLADSVFYIGQNLRDTCLQIEARTKQATYLDDMGAADSALTQLYWARGAYRGICDSSVLIDILANLTNIYLTLGELSRIDSVSDIALSSWNSEWKAKRPRFIILNNWAIARFYSNDVLAANALFRQAYQEAFKAGDAIYIQKALLNLGTIKAVAGNLDSAFYFINAAAISAEENHDPSTLMTIMLNLANIETKRGKNERAISLLDSAYHMATTFQNIEVIAGVQNARADLYATMHKYKNAYAYLKDYSSLRETLLDTQRVKAVTEMMEKYESEKKARQIQELKVEKLDSDLRNTRITAARNRFMYIGIGILVVALGLWSRLRYTRRSRAAIEKEKDISEGLLLNILPESVAAELKAKGYADAKHYADATILFSDFKEFTAITERMSASELVDELNVCFKAFDEIVSKYGIEKIKTIGDAYMSAGGLPDTNTATAADVVQAALDMQHFVISRKKEREAQQLPAFEMRVGIHTGPVVAGIVGVKKFQYDIWGDAVNIASRLESSGEPGRVNISEDAYQRVRDNPAFKFTPRGRIQAKGKGELEMYFVDRV